MERLVRRSIKDGPRFWKRVALLSTHKHHQHRLSSSSTSSSPGRTASRRLYRILQRQCIDLKRALPSEEAEEGGGGNCGETMILLQPTLHPRQSGNHRILSIKTVPPSSAGQNDDDIRNLLVFFRDWNEDNHEEKDAYDWFDTIQNIRSSSSISEDDNDKDQDDDPSAYLGLDWDFTDESTLWTTVSSIQRAIRHAFRHSSGNEENRHMMNKYAIRAVQLLMEQAEMHRLSSISFEKDVRVVATSKHTGSSHPGPLRGSRPKNRFNYRIRIENLSDQDTIQLLGRSWLIEDLGLPGVEVAPQEDNPIIVDAPNSGAVGQLPVLRPGDAFEYMSGCDLTTSRGVMQGSFHLAIVPMNTPSITLQNTIPEYNHSDRFEVKVKPFPLEATTTIPSTSK